MSKRMVDAQAANMIMYMEVEAATEGATPRLN